MVSQLVGWLVDRFMLQFQLGCSVSTDGSRDDEDDDDDNNDDNDNHGIRIMWVPGLE